VAAQFQPGQGIPADAALQQIKRDDGRKRCWERGDGDPAASKASVELLLDRMLA
jgi:polyferredoxin